MISIKNKKNGTGHGDCTWGPNVGLELGMGLGIELDIIGHGAGHETRHETSRWAWDQLVVDPDKTWDQAGHEPEINKGVT